MLKFRMSDLLKNAVIFMLILFLLRKKVAIGYVMLICSAALAGLYAMNIHQISLAIKKAATGSITLKLLLSLSLIRIFELVLRENNILSSMMSAVRGSRISRRAVIISMPLLIGMLPSLGGAYFSAPMVKEATEGMDMDNEELAFINYWFRHPWEFILPLYPGIVFASAVAGIPLRSLVMSNLVFAAAMMVTGFVFSMRSVEASGNAHEEAVDGSDRNWPSFIPIGIVLILVIFLRIELHYALVVVLVPLFIFYRYSAEKIYQAFRYGFSMDVIIMIAGIVLFKETMEASGAIANLARIFSEHGIPSLPIFCILPFIAGMLTGHTVGFVGSSFPLLLSLGGDEQHLLIYLAFVAGFVGVMLSPVHLCLVLTREYFKADLAGIYKKIVPAGLMIFAIALMQYYFRR